MMQRTFSKILAVAALATLAGVWLTACGEAKDEITPRDLYRTVDIYGNTPNPLTIELTGNII